jgi:hypothetical protein
MNQAVYDSVGDWADELQRVMLADAGPDAGPRQRFELATRQTLESFSGPARGLWASQLELLSLGQRNEELRQFLASVQVFAGQGLAELFLGIDPETEPEASRLAGPVVHALFIGLLAKWSLDPEQAPTAADLAAGLQIIAERITAGGAGPAG